MKLRVGMIGLGLALVLSESLVLPPKGAAAQENSKEATSRKVRVRTVPEYPSLARQLKVTGKVKIEATVTADGHVTNTRVIGGSPLLVSSAVDAVKRWRFEAAPKETTEIVEFEFNGQNAR
jgi:TonB family protein